MKKLIQPHSGNWLDDFQQRVLDFFTLYPNAHAYGLIDCAFSEQCYDALKQQRPILQWRSLFDLSGTLDGTLAAASPTLIPLRRDTANAWRAVMRTTNGMPMVSVIVTPESLDALAQRLQTWCMVDADGEKLCFRFADTRRLPDITATLTPQQHGQFFGPAHAWIYRTRTAQWASLDLPAVSQPPADAVHLNSSQCAHLIGASEADEIMTDLAVHEPELMQTLPSAQAYAMVCKALIIANERGIKGPDIVSWCGRCLRQPVLSQL